MLKVKWLKFRRDIEGLVAILRDANTAARRAACWALHDIGDPRSVRPLIAALQNADQEGRRLAAWTLWVLATKEVRGTERAAEPLGTALEDPDQGVRENACRALADLASNGHTRALKLLIAALGNAHGDVRLNSARLLGYIDDARTVEPLIATLAGDEDVEVRKRAALSLGRRGDGRAVEPLIAALGDKDEPIRQCARAALETLYDSGRLDPADQQRIADSGIDRSDVSSGPRHRDSPPTGRT